MTKIIKIIKLYILLFVKELDSLYVLNSKHAIFKGLLAETNLIIEL